MAERDIGLIVVSDPSNMAWLTGYDGWSFYVHQAVLLAHEGEPVWWGRGMDAAGAVRTAFMREDNIVGYDDSYVQNPDKHPMETLAALIRSAAGARAASASNWTITASPPPPTGRWPRACRRREIVDATGLVNWQRAVKSPAEIEYMRRAARIVEQMHAEGRRDGRAGPAEERAGRRDLHAPRSSAPTAIGATIRRSCRWRRRAWTRRRRT